MSQTQEMEQGLRPGPPHSPASDCRRGGPPGERVWDAGSQAGHHHRAFRTGALVLAGLPHCQVAGIFSPLWYLEQQHSCASQGGGAVPSTLWPWGLGMRPPLELCVPDPVGSSRQAYLTRKKVS